MKLTGYELSLLPTGVELLARDNRECNQIELLVELNEKESIEEYQESLLGPIQPCPSLAKILSYEYSGDELHTRFSKDLDSFSVRSVIPCYA